MKKHGLKILIGVFLLILAAIIWAGMSLRGRVRKMSNAVKTQAEVLKKNSQSTQRSANTGTDFQSGQVLNRIRSNWSRSPEVPERSFPTEVLEPPSSNQNSSNG